MLRLSCGKWRLSVLHLILHPLSVTDYKCADQQSSAFLIELRNTYLGTAWACSARQMKRRNLCKRRRAEILEKKKKWMQIVSLLIPSHKSTVVDNCLSPIEQPIERSRRPYKMMHNSSFTQVSELIELDWNSCWNFLFPMSVEGGGGSFVSGKCTWTPPHQLPICYEALVTIWSLWGALLQFKWVSDREKTISGANNAAQMKNVLIFEAALWQKQWQWWSQCQLFSFKCHLSSMSFFCSGGMQAWCWLLATIDHWFYSKWKACQKTRNSGIY